MKFDWFAIAQDMAEKARAKVAEDTRRLEALREQRAAESSHMSVLATR